MQEIQRNNCSWCTCIAVFPGEKYFRLECPAEMAAFGKRSYEIRFYGYLSRKKEEVYIWGNM